jgi:hypothetical protein
MEVRWATKAVAARGLGGLPNFQSFFSNRQVGISLFLILCFFFLVPYGNDNTFNTHKKWTRGTRLG